MVPRRWPAHADCLADAWAGWPATRRSTPLHWGRHVRAWRGCLAGSVLLPAEDVEQPAVQAQEPPIGILPRACAATPAAADHRVRQEDPSFPHCLPFWRPSPEILGRRRGVQQAVGVRRGRRRRLLTAFSWVGSGSHVPGTARAADQGRNGAGRARVAPGLRLAPASAANRFRPASRTSRFPAATWGHTSARCRPSRALEPDQC